MLSVACKSDVKTKNNWWKNRNTWRPVSITARHGFVDESASSDVLLTIKIFENFFLRETMCKQCNRVFYFLSPELVRWQQVMTKHNFVEFLRKRRTRVPTKHAGMRAFSITKTRIKIFSFLFEFQQPFVDGWSCAIATIYWIFNSKILKNDCKQTTCDSLPARQSLFLLLSRRFASVFFRGSNGCICFSLLLFFRFRSFLWVWDSS